MHRAVSVSATHDLRPFIKVLRSYHLPHHVTEESGTLVIWAPDQEQVVVIASAWQRWQDGTLALPENNEYGGAREGGPAVPMLPVKSLLQGFLGALWLAPVTVILILACVLVAVISDLGADVMSVRSLFFPDVIQPGQFPLAALISGLDSPGDWIRTLTPALLHFGPVHLIFNLLWLWFFGRMMEPQFGKPIYLLLILLLAFSANISQYLWSGTPNFGGMSGVVYGQIGLIWMWQTLRPQSRLRLPLPMIMVFLVALVLMEILASSMIASAAHLGGLVAGMLSGLVLGTVFKRAGNRSGADV
ncbi:MAG: rhomboid family intramembrane serine protease [Pseudohongiella sp.]|nr:rhomboid family intramembrane serine protease [Pseudohongiella sp.]